MNTPDSATPTAHQPSRSEHWNTRYADIGTNSVSWYEPRPAVSLVLLDIVGTSPDASVIDIGGGASLLVDNLIDAGHHDLGVLDVSAVALNAARDRVANNANGSAVDGVEWIEHDLLTWEPQRRWDVWHDRAVLHFLLDDTDREAYVDLLRQTVVPGGAFVIGVFAEDGPTHCSALPVRRYSAHDLRQLLGDVQILAEQRHVHHTPAGGDQPFRWIAGRLG